VRLALPQMRQAPSKAGTLSDRMEAYERETILAELKHHNRNMTETARALGLERSHLYKKCAQLGIDIKSLRRPEE